MTTSDLPGGAMATSAAAIQQNVERERMREDFRQEAEASWARFQETGRHLTGVEVRCWLGTWGTEAERPMPECHE